MITLNVACEETSVYVVIQLVTAEITITTILKKIIVTVHYFYVIFY